MSFFSNIWDKIKSLKNQPMYLIIGGVVFVLGILFHFPLEKFSSVITNTIQKETGYIVQMEKVSLTLPIGLTAQNVTIQPTPGTEQPFLLSLEKLTLRPSIFSLITYPFRKSFGFSYRAVRGKEIWSGSAGLGKEDSSFDVEVENFAWTGSFPLDQNPMFAGQSVQLSTVVDIDMSIHGKTLALQQGNISEADGSLEIHSKKMDINAPIIKTLNMTELDIESKLKKGLLTVDKLDFKAPNLSNKASGSIKIEPFFPNSQLTIEAKLKADPSDQNISSLLQVVGTMYNLTPSADGVLSLKVAGTLNSPETLSITSF